VKVLPLNLATIQDGLVATRLGSKLHYFHELDSTNAYARRLADEGAPEGEIVIAERQTHGRGRLGRTWVSPPYVNLYFSMILRPSLSPVDAPQLTLMAAVALADAIAVFSSKPPDIKWPNDILVNGKKLAGVLTESSCSFERVEFMILGIGVNVNFTRESMPEAIRERATSLLIIRESVTSREDFLRRLIHDLDRCYGILEERGFGAIAPEWEARFGLRGRRVRVEMMDQIFTGRAKGIDRDGALLVENNNGAVQRIIAGDVIALED
jgi:BirA family biotin operon repressor/biotin-[acetyl-CoA-carboxylase] ligase